MMFNRRKQINKIGVVVKNLISKSMNSCNELDG